MHVKWNQSSQPSHPTISLPVSGFLHMQKTSSPVIDKDLFFEYGGHQSGNDICSAGQFSTWHYCGSGA